MKILSITNICVSVMNFLKVCSIILIENNNFHFNETVCLKQSLIRIGFTNTLTVFTVNF